MHCYYGKWFRNLPFSFSVVVPGSRLFHFTPFGNLLWDHGTMYSSFSYWHICVMGRLSCFQCFTITHQPPMQLPLHHTGIRQVTRWVCQLYPKILIYGGKWRHDMGRLMPWKDYFRFWRQGGMPWHAGPCEEASRLGRRQKGWGESMSQSLHHVSCEKGKEEQRKWLSFAGISLVWLLWIMSAGSGLSGWSLVVWYLALDDWGRTILTPVV